MKVRVEWLLLAGAVALGCNSIVGVTDVKRKPSGIDTSTPSSSSGTSGSRGSAGNGDPVTTDDDDTEGQGTSSGGTSGGTTSGGVVAKPECNGKLDCERLVFVTNATFTGNLGGLAGADQKCFEAAKKIPAYAGRGFRAWLSDATIDAATRIPHGMQAYKRLDGSVVATSWTDLADGTLNLPPALDETGKPLPGTESDRSAWTGTDMTGKWDHAGDTCNDWSSDQLANSGSYGDSQRTDFGWCQIDGAFPPSTSSCNAAKHIYCIEF